MSDFFTINKRYIKNILLSIKINRSNFVFILFLKFIFYFTKQKIKFENNFFYLENYKKIIKFYDSKHSVYSYIFGIDRRINFLKKSYFLENIKFTDNDCIIDVGANNGDFSLCFNKKINYIGIEPSPQIFECLKYNTSSLNCKLYNQAAYDYSEGNVLFYLCDDGADSSTIKPKNYTDTISIKTITLDKIISETSFDKIKLIKIEAEGAEPEVLKGLKKSYSKVEYIVIDVSNERGVNEDYTITECTNILLNNNFKFEKFFIEGNKNSRVSVLYKNNLI